MTKKFLTIFLTIAMAAAAFTGCGTPDTDENPAASGEPAALKVGLLGTSVKPVGVLAADAQGYFAEEGVHIQFEKVTSMNDAYLAVSTGDLDVYLFSSTAAATFISQGTTTLRVFGGTAAEGSEIMAAAGSGITLASAADFKGLTVGCFMAETGQVVLKNYLTQQGYTIGGPEDGADVTFIYYSDTSAGIEALKKGEFDLILTNASLGYYSDDYGVEVVANVSDFVPVYPCCRQTCNQTTYESNFDALVKFEIAALRGYEYSQTHREETLDLLVDYSGEDRDFLKAQIYGTDSYTPAMRLSLDPDKKACVAFYEAMMSLGEIEDTVPVDWGDYVVSDVYETALDTLIEREPDNNFWTGLKTYFEANN